MDGKPQAKEDSPHSDDGETSSSPSKKAKTSNPAPRTRSNSHSGIGVTKNTRIKTMRKLNSPTSVATDLPISDEMQTMVKGWRQEAENILNGQDDRLMIVVGPCSVHDVNAALEYAQLLKQAADKFKDSLFIIMRVYFEKPRSVIGWKGLINNPDLDGSFNINKGLTMARKLLLDINQVGLPCGTEFLDTVSPQYTSDLVTWGAIGARTTESQIHRELASGLSCPVGFKNGTSGNVQVAVDAIRSARGQHCFLGVNELGNAAIVETSGNPACHCILRGGTGGTNYDADNVKKATNALNTVGLRDSVMIDCSHANSEKNHKNQPIVASDIAKQISSGSHAIFGVMIESNLKEGKQKMDPGVTDPKDLVYGQSITDACIDFKETESVLNELSNAVLARRKQ